MWSILVIASAVVAVSAADTIFSANGTAPSPESNLRFSLQSSSGNWAFDVLPLTPQAGLGVAPSSNQYRRGGLVLITADRASQINQLSRQSIAYIDCEASTTSGYLTPSSLFNTVISTPPSAIVLYSTASDHCNYTNFGKNNFEYASIYTMLQSNASDMARSLANNNYPLTATILNPKATPDGSGTDPSGARPTTQIAMIILYSITGLITALFLVIIASGAIRAHRHPERYGPRAGMLGRPRQSRAKGIARAMLETLPIVKFGESQETKPATDVELANKHQEESSKETAKDNTAVKEVFKEPEAPTTAADGPSVPTPAVAGAAKEGADTSKESPPVAENESDNGLSCSICTEDFVMGEDIRVLPCDHKYHPACVDPWLLNVSGTCPLCRIDLRPATTQTSSSPTSETLAPPLTEDTHAPTATAASAHAHTGRHRISRYIELRRMPAEERMEALRALRQEQRRQSILAAESGAAGTAAGALTATSTTTSPPSATAAAGTAQTPLPPPYPASPSSSATAADPSRPTGRRLSAMLGSAFRIHTRRMPGQRGDTVNPAGPGGIAQAGPSGSEQTPWDNRSNGRLFGTL